MPKPGFPKKALPLWEIKSMMKLAVMDMHATKMARIWAILRMANARVLESTILMMMTGVKGNGLKGSGMESEPSITKSHPTGITGILSAVI